MHLLSLDGCSFVTNTSAPIVQAGAPSTHNGWVGLYDRANLPDWDDEAVGFIIIAQVGQAIRGESFDHWPDLDVRWAELEVVFRQDIIMGPKDLILHGTGGDVGFTIQGSIKGRKEISNSDLGTFLVFCDRDKRRVFYYDKAINNYIRLHL